ncbi:MAG: SUMF1/EgtB/PvdO family nonheme iron enzyme [Luteitalea sp.]|nr:SUMF1/EgtB/PvdO family nonheme iron enzyme [Luteitalea sp.]
MLRTIALGLVTLCLVGSRSVCPQQPELGRIDFPASQSGRRPAAAIAAHGTPARDLVRIPAASYDVSDRITTLELRVSVSEFLLGATEVTQREYEAMTGENPSVSKGSSRPVENVSWWDAIRFCNLRSAKEGLTPCYDMATGRRPEPCSGYRLPTEAEWMVAAGPPPAATALDEVANVGDTSTKSLRILHDALEKGTMPVCSRTRNAHGVCDLRGNVWEWCGDHYGAVASPDAVRDPVGPAWGPARVIRGGSFVTTTSRWSRDYRSSMRADSRSRYTGFRVARSLDTTERRQPQSPTFLEPYDDPPPAFEGSIGSLSPLAPKGTSVEAWQERAGEIRAKWEALLGIPKRRTGKPAARVLRELTQRNFVGQMIDLEMEPGASEKIYVLRPSHRDHRPWPVMIVPFYDVDTPAAADLGGRRFDPDRGVNAYAYTAAQHGYLAVAVRWFGESYGESYSEAVANLALRDPGTTGLGKWVADARRLVEYIETLPDADADRIGIIGHSLGGKMALYAAAFEPRIRAAVSSEPGIGLTFSNYEDYWYLGEKVTALPPGTDQHELIALIAPRPFLLVGGDEYDTDESWHYINAARAAYRLVGKPEHVGYLNHRAGHTPTPEAVSRAFDWLNHFLKP